MQRCGCSLLSFGNTVGKGEIAHKKQFLLFPQCFHNLGDPSIIFIRSKIVASVNLFSMEQSKICLGKSFNPEKNCS